MSCQLELRSRTDEPLPFFFLELERTYPFTKVVCILDYYFMQFISLYSSYVSYSIVKVTPIVTNLYNESQHCLLTDDDRRI